MDKMKADTAEQSSSMSLSSAEVGQKLDRIKEQLGANICSIQSSIKGLEERLHLQEKSTAPAIDRVTQVAYYTCEMDNRMGLCVGEVEETIIEPLGLKV